MERRPEETDLRVMATAVGVARLARGHGLTPYETAIGLKLALRALLLETRAPMATIHQFRGFLRELEDEQAEPLEATDERGAA